MIHLNKKAYPYMEEVNEGILREFRRLLPDTGRVLDVGCGRAARSSSPCPTRLCGPTGCG